MDGLPPSGEFFLGQDHDVSLSTLARDQKRLPVIRHAVEIACHVLAQNGSYGFELLQKPYSIEQLSRILHKVGRWRTGKRGAAE